MDPVHKIDDVATITRERIVEYVQVCQRSDLIQTGEKIFPQTRDLVPGKIEFFQHFQPTEPVDGNIHESVPRHVDCLQLSSRIRENI